MLFSGCDSNNLGWEITVNNESSYDIEYSLNGEKHYQSARDVQVFHFDYRSSDFELLTTKKPIYYKQIDAHNFCIKDLKKYTVKILNLLNIDVTVNFNPGNFTEKKDIEKFQENATPTVIENVYEISNITCVYDSNFIVNYTMNYDKDDSSIVYILIGS